MQIQVCRRPAFLLFALFKRSRPVGLRDFGGSCRAPLRLAARFARLFVAPLLVESLYPDHFFVFALRFGVCRALLVAHSVMYFSTLPRSLPSQNTPYIQNASQKGDEKGGENRSAAALPAPASRTYMASQKAYVIPREHLFVVTETTTDIRRPHTVVARRSKPSRAGGERGFPRAGVAARGQKAECPRAIRPRVKRPPSA